MEGDVLLCQFEGCSHSFLFGLEGLAPFADRDRALMVDPRVTFWGPVVTIMLLLPLALPCVAAPSV